MRKIAFLIMVAALLAIGGAAYAADYPSKNFDCTAPAGPGSGFDTTMRLVTKTLTEEGIIKTAMPVTNRPGGGGGIALDYMQRRKGVAGRLLPAPHPHQPHRADPARLYGHHADLHADQ